MRKQGIGIVANVEEDFGDCFVLQDILQGFFLGARGFESLGAESMHIDETDARGSWDAGINQKGKNGNRALATEVYALEIDIHGWFAWLWRCMVQDQPVDQLANLLRCFDDFGVDFLHVCEALDFRLPQEWSGMG